MNNNTSAIPPPIFSLERRNADRWQQLQTKFHYLNFSLLSLPSPAPNKTIQFRCTGGCGGLGDRVRGLIMAYLFALLSNRKLVVDMRWPCAFTNYFQPNFYKWVPTLDFKFKGSSLYIRAIDNDNKLMIELNSTSFIDKWSKYDDIQIATNMDFIGAIFSNPHLRKHPIVRMFLQNMSPDEANIQTLFPLLFEILLRPTNHIVRVVDELLANKSSERLLCTHLRIGRNPSNPADHPFEYRFAITNKVIEFISQNKLLDKNPSISLFVSSDSANATEQVMHHFLNRSFSVPGPILQIDHPVTGVDCHAGFTKVVADFYLLGECETVILTNSGFSSFANRRRKNPYQGLYKYDPNENKVEQCLDLRTSQGWEPARSISTKLYCPVRKSNNEIKEIL
jgi:hypothetical protein